MNKRQIEQHTADKRCLIFLDGRRQWPESISILAPELRVAVAEVIRLSEIQASAVNLRGVERSTPQATRYALRKLIKAISRRGTTLLKGMPGIRDSLRLPLFKCTNGQLVEAARRILSNTRPHAAVFVEAGIKPDVFDRIERAADDLERLEAKPDKAATRRSRATEDLKDALAACRRIIDDLDSMIELEMLDADVRRWRTAKTVKPIKRPGPKLGSKRPPRPPEGPDAPSGRRRPRRRRR